MGLFPHIKGSLVGVGVDLIRVARVEQAYRRRPGRFLRRIFSAAEQDELAERGNPPSSLAGRFAAKEAVAKALGCGIGPVSWSELEILRDNRGKPYVHLLGGARRLARKLGISGVAVSFAHDGPWAVAFAVAYRKREARGGGRRKKN